MSEPAKDEAELVRRIRQAIWHHGDGTEDAEAALAAIRAAGWAVVPVEPTMDMICAAATHKASEEHSLYFGIYEAMLAAAPGVEP